MHVSHGKGPFVKINREKAENQAFAEFKYLKNQLYRNNQRLFS